MTINVTQKHIKKGDRYNSVGCPIALALTEQCGKKELCIGPSYVIVHNGEKIVPLPLAAVKFITLFDNGCSVEPLSFEIEL